MDKALNMDASKELQRYPDWAPRLNRFISSVRDNRFEWGKWDCVTFASDAVQVMTGVDMIPEYRGQYSTEQEGDELLRKIGEGKLYRTMRKKLGRSVPGVYGHKGDVAFYEGRCGIILGRMAMFTGSEGYVFVKLTHIQRAFHIGCYYT